MNEFDNKIIQAVLGKPLEAGMPIPNFVEKIKQAFADEGYLDNKFSVWTPDKKQPQTSEQKAYSDKIFKQAIPVMACDEFVKRLDEQLTSQTRVKTQFSYLEIMEAAKRAAFGDKDASTY